MALGGGGSVSPGAVKAGEAFIVISIKDKISQQLKSIQAKFQQFQQKVNKMGVQAGTLAAGGLMGGMAAVPLIDIAKSYDDVIRATAAVAGETSIASEGFQRLDALAKSLGTTTAFTATEVAQLMGELARVGRTIPEIEASTRHVINAARATQYDPALTAKIIAETMNQFKLSAKDTQRVADVLSETANATNTTMESLGYSFAYAGVACKEANMSFEETAALIGVLGQEGRLGSVAGTDVRRLAILMKDSAETMRVFGFSAYDAHGKFMGLVPAIRLLKESIKDMSEEERNQKLKEFFGILGITGSTIITRAIKDLDGLTDRLEHASDGMGRAAEIAKFMEGGIGGAIRRLRGELQTLIVEIGETFAPVLMETAGAIKFILSGIKEWVQNNTVLAQNFARVVISLMAIAGASALLLGVLLMFKLIIAAVGLLTASLGIMWAVFVSPVTVTVLMLASIANQFEYLRHVVDDVGESIGDTFREMGAIFAEVWSGIVASVMKGDLGLAMAIAGTGIKLVWAKVTLFLRKNWNDFAFFFEEMWVGLVTGIKMMWNSFTSWLTGLVSDAVFAIVDFAADALEFFGDAERADRWRKGIREFGKSSDEIERDRIAREKEIIESAAEWLNNLKDSRAATLKAAEDRVAALQELLGILTGNAHAVQAEIEAKGGKTPANLLDEVGLATNAAMLTAATRGTFSSGNYRGALGIGPVAKIEERQLAVQEKMLGELEDINENGGAKFE